MQTIQSNTVSTDRYDLAMQYRQCAELHERASRHYREAARLYECDDTEQGAIHSSIARRHLNSATQAELLRNAPQSSERRNTL